MRTLSIIFLLVLSVACGHQKVAKEDYSPNVSFQKEDKNFEGNMLLPKNFKEKVPLVIVVHEWWGKTPYIRQRAQMIADKGYAAMTVDLYGNNKTVETPKEATELATPFYKNPTKGIELLKKYVELAKKDPHIDANQIYVIGFCFGGTQALNLARSGADIAGVVSFHGGLASNTQTAATIKPKILVLHGQGTYTRRHKNQRY